MVENLIFLLDTNVIIQFEEVGSDRKIKDPFQRLHNLLTKNSLRFIYHPLTEDDLNNDGDEERLGEMVSRLKKYPQLDNPPLGNGAKLEESFGGISNANDLIDCQLLFAISRNCATYLITEDRGIHKRAENTDLDDRILYVGDAIDLIIRQFESENIQLPNINHQHLYNLNLQDPFFDSLENDYNEFKGWIKRNAQRGCWTIKIGDNLTGLCIYKYDEIQEHIDIRMPSMKLSTFKVSDDYQGRKFGELLLKMAHLHAVANSMASIWVTVHDRQSKLIQFLKKFGFFVHEDLKGNDMVFFKLMAPPDGLPRMKPLEYYIHYSPHYYDNEEIKKFVIPIRPTFHDMLFPEVTPRGTQGDLFDSLSDNPIPGNTIRKVYLCHAKIKKIPPGSLIYFYRSSPEQYIHTQGIVERARRLTDMESLAAAIGKRSVYSYEQVENMIKKEVLVIDFRLVAHRNRPINLADLLDQGVFNRKPPQSIAELDSERYLNLKRLWGGENS